MNRKKIAYILIFISVVLLILNISALNFKASNNDKYLGIASNLLLILAMVFTIRNSNKKK
ncbi:hypothetical protein FSS13T_17710 [Flavobacterium saliperosum S13]|uniref:Uncharacterized protein n=2 Tax=Flavobacterium saliperosum TaxID=329186 RepID=A0A1G4VJJ1_9FLAO|nr:hypothetical protein FSS13T_17710 [Flavobacterium saliperosum S13]SCX07703.1 hypothetical protein SAMN02927925_01212 [Flavobacterium saliperosum]